MSSSANLAWAGEQAVLAHVRACKRLRMIALGFNPDAPPPTAPSAVPPTIIQPPTTPPPIYPNLPMSTLSKQLFFPRHQTPLPDPPPPTPTPISKPTPSHSTLPVINKRSIKPKK